MTALRKLSARQLNRTLLARQLLLQRVSLPIPDVLDRLCGIQNQNAPNAYLRLWSCVAGFRRDDLTQAYESGAVVQGTMMRGTIHTVSATDYHSMLAAIREPFRAWARRVNRGVDDADRAAVVARVQAALAEGPIKRPDLIATLADASRPTRQTIDIDAEILRLPPSGTWARRRADLCGLADSVMKHADIEPEAGRRHLVDRYLHGFGPATADSIALFCGIPLAVLRPTLEAMNLDAYTDETGDTLLDIPGAPISTGDEEAPLRFLPSWDSILLVHSRRTAVVAEKYRPILFHVHVGQCPPTFMVDGTVAGAWHWNAKADRVDLEPFSELPKATLAALEDAACALAEFHRS